MKLKAPLLPHYFLTSCVRELYVLVVGGNMSNTLTYIR